MKAILPDIESQFSALLIAESMDLIRQTTEYKVQQTGEGTYQVISTAPAYHVELVQQAENVVSAICHCTTYKRTKQCKHALAGILMLRDTRLRKRKARPGQQHQAEMLDDAVAKINVHELKRFVKLYAKSHAGFRIELLAETLYLTKKPDYNALLMDITPIDKNGQLKVNRNNLKLLRGTLTILHKQAQQLVRDKSLTGAFQILESTLHHIQRLMFRFPVYQAQLATDYKIALRTFEALCQQVMAPRLQDAVIKFAFSLSDREGHLFFKGYPIVLRLVEGFILDAKSREAAITLVEKKMKTDVAQQALWAGLLLHWNRIWQRPGMQAKLAQQIQSQLPEILLTFHQQQDHEDVLFTLPFIRHADLPDQMLKTVLQAGLRSAKMFGHHEWIRQLQTDLSLHFFDPESFEQLLQSDRTAAKTVTQQLDDQFVAGQQDEADRFLVQAWNMLGEYDHMYERLANAGNMELLLEYTPALLATHRDAIITQLAKHIHATREAYGGVQARQRLATIFSHLKSIDLYSPVIDLVKRMESKPTTAEKKRSVIKGFVFDLDGVIVDTAIHHFQSWKKLMLELGVVIADEDDHHTRGASRMESLEYLLQTYGLNFSQAEKEALAAKKNSYYLEAIMHITPDDLLPGAQDFLVASRKEGLLLALGSASKNARGVLAKLGIEDQFDAILDGNDAQESKPHPEIFIKASEALGLDPSEVVVFEDAAKGVQAALAAGNHVVGLGDPMTLRDADIVIADLAHASPAAIIERIA